MAQFAADESIDDTGRTAAQRLSDHVFGRKADRIVIDHQTADTMPHPDIAEHLGRHGFQIKNYRDGIVSQEKTIGNPEKGIPYQKKMVDLSLMKALHQTNAPEEMKQKFVNDPNRNAAKTEGLKIVISRRPHDIAAMSTGQHWESCQTLGGDVLDHEGKAINKREIPEGKFNQHVPKAIGDGAHVAYLVKHEDDIDKHNAPISRMSLNPFHSEEGGHSVLRPSGVTYGTDVSGFHETLKAWSEKHFPTKKGHQIYERSDQVYPEGQPKVFNFDHDDSMEALRRGKLDIMSDNPDPKFLHSAIDHIKGNGFKGIKQLSANVALKQEHIDHLEKAFSETHPSTYDHESMEFAGAYCSTGRYAGIEKHLVNYADHKKDENKTSHVSIFAAAKGDTGYHAAKIATSILGAGEYGETMTDEQHENARRAVGIIHHVAKANGDLNSATDRIKNQLGDGIHRILANRKINPEHHESTAKLLVDHPHLIEHDLVRDRIGHELFTRSHVSDDTKNHLAKTLLKASAEKGGPIDMHERLLSGAIDHALGNPDLHKHVGLAHVQFIFRNPHPKDNAIQWLNSQHSGQVATMTSHGVHD